MVTIRSCIGRIIFKPDVSLRATTERGISLVNGLCWFQIESCMQLTKSPPVLPRSAGVGIFTPQPYNQSTAPLCIPKLVNLNILAPRLSQAFHFIWCTYFSMDYCRLPAVQPSGLRNSHTTNTIVLEPNTMLVTKKANFCRYAFSTNLFDWNTFTTRGAYYILNTSGLRLTARIGSWIS